MKEYKIFVYQEGWLGSLFLGQSKVDPVKLTDSLNEQAKEGWKVITVEREKRRMFVFFAREALIYTLERDMI
ncbi:MAG: DUF4177 domain-containing protein [Campylobacterales bacterium]|nr:DUF4177 domain-containing protein [Campylobacterales bacterium]